MRVIKEWREARSMCFRVGSGNHDRWRDQRGKKTVELENGTREQWGEKMAAHFKRYTKKINQPKEMEKKKKKKKSWRRKKRWGEAECDGHRRESQRELERGEGTRAALEFFYFLLPSGEPSLIYPRCNCIHLTQHISVQWASCTHTHAVALTHTHTPLGSYLALLQPAYNSSALSLTQNKREKSQLNSSQIDMLKATLCNFLNLK